MLTRYDLTWIGVCALATMSVALAVLQTGSATAVDVVAVSPEIKTPVLIADNCQLSLRLPEDVAVERRDQRGAQLAPGQVPAVELVATNTGSDQATIHWNANLRVQTMRDMMSRVARPNPAAWQQEGELTLSPGQTAVVKLNANAKLEAGSNANFTLQVGKQQVRALTLFAKAANAPAVKGQ